MDKLNKNQIVVYSIVLMLVVAGYLNYIENDKSVEISANTQNTTNIGDATLVSNNETTQIGEDTLKNENGSNQQNAQENTESAATNSEQTSEKNGSNNNNSQENQVYQESADTSSSINSNTNIIIDEDDEYFANSKLEREKMYSQMLETYQKILENTTISEEQKSIATTEIRNINNTRNAIIICENLIAIKGFDEVVILANGDSVNVVIKAKDLTTEEIAQIQNIITREMETTIENIHIMKK